MKLSYEFDFLPTEFKSKNKVSTGFIQRCFIFSESFLFGGQFVNPLSISIETYNLDDVCVSLPTAEVVNLFNMNVLKRKLMPYNFELAKGWSRGQTAEIYFQLEKLHTARSFILTSETKSKNSCFPSIRKQLGLTD